MQLNVENRGIIMVQYSFPEEAYKYVDEKSLEKFARGLLDTDSGKIEFVDLLRQVCLVAPNGELC